VVHAASVPSGYVARVRRLLALGLLAVAATAVAAPAGAATPKRDCGTLTVRSIARSGALTLRVIRLGADTLTCRRARAVARWAYRHASRTDHAVLGDPPGWTCRGVPTDPDGGGICRRRGSGDAQGVLILNPAQQAG
jgi:hypothetical protein